VLYGTIASLLSLVIRLWNKYAFFARTTVSPFIAASVSTKLYPRTY
jgi:hypothetical protein